MVKSEGPRIDPWGVSLNIFCHLNKQPFKTMCHSLSDKKPFKNSMIQS